MNAKHSTPRTDAALALVSEARKTEPDYKCHDALIVSHVTLEMDYNGLREVLNRVLIASRANVGGAVLLPVEGINTGHALMLALEDARVTLEAAK